MRKWVAAEDRRPERLRKREGSDPADDFGALAARGTSETVGLLVEHRDGSTFTRSPFPVGKGRRPSFADVLDQPETKLGEPDY